MTDRCPACDCTHWRVVQFSGGEQYALETRRCQDCGREWTEGLRA
jgi:uncharacterized Zn finger protein